MNPDFELNNDNSVSLRLISDCRYAKKSLSSFVIVTFLIKSTFSLEKDSFKSIDIKLFFNEKIFFILLFVIEIEFEPVVASKCKKAD